jgi:hypothetical protein
MLDNRAALYPVPVPISTTVWPDRTSSISSMNTIRLGIDEELVGRRVSGSICVVTEPLL